MMMSRKLVLFTILVGFTLNLATLIFLGRWNKPPPPGDGQDYDNLAFNLAKGKGYGYDWDDPQWRQPYEKSNGDGVYNEILKRQSDVFEPTSTRPPLLPLFLAAAYKIFGRAFWVWNIVNALLFALVAGCTVWMAQEFFGQTIAKVTAVAVSLDFSYKWFSADILTEAFACLFTLGLTWFAWQFWQTGKKRHVLWLAFFTAISFLLRSIFIFWVPLLALFIFCGSVRGRKVQFSALFLLMTLLLTSPWMIRNCRLHQGFMPLGDQGGIKLPGGYCDAALKNRGIWVDPQTGGYFVGVEEHLRQKNLSPGLFNRELAAAGSAVAKQWMRENWASLPLLAFLKLLSEMHLGYGYLLPLWIMAFIGLFRSLFKGGYRRNESLILWFFIGMNALPIMATWSVGGRLIMPVLPHLHVLFAVGLIGVFGGMRGASFKFENPLKYARHEP